MAQQSRAHKPTRWKAYSIWKKVLFALAILVFLLPQSILAVDHSFVVSYTTYDTTYDAILRMYIRVLNAYGTHNTGRHDLFNELIISDFDSDYDGPMKNRIAETKKRVGFCICDLNQDGIEELSIGENAGCVYEVFTADNGKIRELIRAGMRYDCALLENGKFYRHSKDGAGHESFELWTMNGVSKVSFIEGYIRDAEPAGATMKNRVNELLFFKMTGSEMYAGTRDTLVSTDHFLSWLAGVDQKVLQLNFIPLELFEQGIGDDYSKIGIVSIDGKTNGNSTVRIRSKASSKGKILRNCKVGTYAFVLGEEENYYKVRINNLEGYIQKDYIKLLSEATNGKRYGVGFENYREWVNTNEKLQEEERPSVTTQPDNAESIADSSAFSGESEDMIIDHYETVEVQRSRQVIDHYETYYTYRDRGDGTFTEVPQERPVYITEYYSETIQQPVYRQIDE